MKLGKALATGVAEERPQTHDEELELPKEIKEIKEFASSGESKALKAPEEVPAAR
ncbi:hypothetical protein ACFWP5_24190 [Streptomyces sp. NPDC058469]|uniref:hypothetical protein n=1 Tax=Streptomyces sp. NPDC058469 TaxID=3346514 RepID=UPI00364AC9C2